MDSPLFVEIVLAVMGVLMATPAGYRLYELVRDRTPGGWSTTSAQVTQITATTTPLRMGDVPLTTRVAYHYASPSGPQEGVAALPIGRAAPEGGRLEIAVHPVDATRSTVRVPRAGRTRPAVTSLAEVVAGVGLVGYAGAAFAGLTQPDHEAAFVAKGGLLVVAVGVTGVGWLTRHRTEPDTTAWVTRLATVENSARPHDGQGWAVHVAYEVDGVVHRGTAWRFTDDRPAPGLKVRIQVDPRDPGRFRCPSSAEMRT